MLKKDKGLTEKNREAGFSMIMERTKAAAGIDILELTMTFMGNRVPIYPTLIWSPDDVILVDAGSPGKMPEIRQAIEKAGIPFSRLNKIIITHQDHDHIGSLAEILDSSPKKIEVFAHAADKPYIVGELARIKIETLRKLLSTLSAEQQEKEKHICEESFAAQVDKTVEDGEVLPFCGGITIIFTPGHTPGHICLYHNQSKTLIAGDALNVLDGKLSGPIKGFSTDIDTANASLEKLTQYDIETVICYHGGYFRDNVNQRILELIRLAKERKAAKR
jgi:glyoxylase-like metal-dependent hydrolase (beta-lactamase superfamily II)